MSDLTREQIQEMHQRKVSWVRELISKGEKGIGSVFMLSNGVDAETVIPVLCDFNSREEFYEFIKMVGGKVAETGFQCEIATYISEAWMSKVDKDIAKELPEDWTPSKDENKIECIVISTVSIDKKELMTSLPFIHRKDGTLAIIEDDVQESDNTEKELKIKELSSNVLITFFIAYAKGMLAKSGTMPNSNFSLN